MKKKWLFSLLSICCIGINAQVVLHKSTTLPRAGDKISKQQIHYFPPGDAGIGKIWELESLEPINEQYELSYTGTDSLLMGTEHQTRYTYRITEDSLWKIGVENYTTYQQALLPELLAVYPMRLEDHFENYFGYTGEYQHAYGMELLGKTSVSVDASGTLIIGGDTIFDVLRVHTQRRFVQDLNLNNFRVMPEDSALWLKKFETTNILHRINTDTLITQTDTYGWYACGYRYPILETVENTLIRHGVPASHFQTAFYYSPIDQYYTLDKDVDNLKVREEALSKRYIEKELSKENLQPEDVLAKYDFRKDKSALVVEYSLNGTCEVEMSVHTVQGEVLAIYPKKELSSGEYREYIVIDPSIPQRYMLRLIINGRVYGEKI